MIGRRDQKRNNVKFFAIGGSIAAMAGYLVGVLTAPKSGKQTRTDIKDTASESAIQAEKELKKLHTDLGRVIDEAKINGDRVSAKTRNDLSELIDKAKDTKEKAREVLSAVHEGEAEDKDLQKAIKDAGKALGHLKKYVKK